MTGILQGILEQGLIYGVMALGVYITYQILDFPDLTVDGSYPLGGVVATIALQNNFNGWQAIIFATIAGGIAGLVTGLIHVKGKVKNLLAGILTMTALYSINLRIAGGMSNIPLFKSETIFNSGIGLVLKDNLGRVGGIVLLLVLVIVIKLILDYYLKTKSGMLLLATGDNKTVVTSLAKDSRVSTVIGLSIANALVAMGGGIIIQQQRYFDLSMGTGTVVICLASVIIGTTAFKKLTFLKTTTAVIFGAIIYKAVVALSIELGFKATDMKLVMSIIFLIVLLSDNFLAKGGKNANT